MATSTSDPHTSASVPGVPATQRRALATLGLGTFVGALVFVVPPLFFPQMAEELQVSIPLLGQIMSLMLALSVLLGLFIGPLADRAGCRPLIVGGLIAAALCLLVFGLAPVFPVLLLASAAGAMTNAGVMGPSFALAGTGFPTTGSGRAISVASAAQAGSAIIGVPVLAAIASAYGWRIAFVVAGIVAIAVVLPARKWLPHPPRLPAGSLTLSEMVAPYGLLLRDRTMGTLYAATLLGAMVWFGLITYLGAFLAETLGLNAGQVGLVYMVAGAGSMVGSLAAGSLLNGVPGRLLMVIGFLGIALCLGLALSSQFSPELTIALLTAAAALAGIEGVAMTTVLSMETPVGAGATMSLRSSLFNLGAAGGSAIGGVLLALGGFGAVGIGLPLFGIAAALLVWSSRRAGIRSVPPLGQPVAQDAN